MDDLISRAEASDALMAWEESSVWDKECLKHRGEPFWVAPSDVINQLPQVQPEWKYTNKELAVFRHGISLSLLSKRSSQHWQYDDDTAKEIEFLEQLYEKVEADMRGDKDEN